MQNKINYLNPEFIARDLENCHNPTKNSIKFCWFDIIIDKRTHIASATLV